MTDLILEDVDQFRDMWGVWVYQAARELGLPPEQALGHAARFTRDKCRTPMQWSDEPNAGFSPPDAETWLPVNHNYAKGVEVASQSEDPNSLLNFYRSLLRVRRQTPTLVAGDYTPLHETAEDYLAFLRGETCLVVLNMSDQAHALSFDLAAQTARLIFSSHIREGQSDDLSRLVVAPFEIYVAELDHE